MKSILQKTNVCYYCGNPNVDVHHVRLGNCSRAKAEKYGLIIYLCRRHHEALHHNAILKDSVQRKAQKTFEKLHSKEEYMNVFGKNYERDENE